MSTPQILALGAVAGGTIFLGLPLGRVRSLDLRHRALLNALAIGILVFLLWDVLSKAIGPLNAALDRASHHHGSWVRVGTLGFTLAVGLVVGLASLVYYDRWMSRRRAIGRPGVGAAVASELRGGLTAGWSPARRLSVFIALGIGFHNLSEGLAIGQSASSGELRLALVLIVGFGLHNATEGFGVVAPLAAEGEIASWGFLGAMGLLAGGPTFLGTVVGQSFTNQTVFLGFLALAAGSILYVVIELLAVARKLGHKELTTWGILLGLMLGVATDMVLTAAGA